MAPARASAPDPPEGGEGILPAPIVVPCRNVPADDLLGKEWLIANAVGAYASSTVLGANTRRYHGLLVAATRPPVGRFSALSCLLDQLLVPDAAGWEKTFDLSTFEFVGAFSPDCREHLVEFRNDVCPTFFYRCGGVELVKEIILAEGANAVAVRYRLLTPGTVRLRIRPFLALRDYHRLRRGAPGAPGETETDQDQPGLMTYLHYYNGIRVEDRAAGPARNQPAPAPGSHAVHIAVVLGAGGPPASRPTYGRFQGDPQWWWRFRYRADLARGQEGLEDLYTPGWFHAALAPDNPVQLIASVDDPKEVNFDAAVQQKRRRLVSLVKALHPDADDASRRLAMASDAFVVSRKRANAQPGTTIVAGYPWFADWGRDAMIALPGLLLATGQHEAALQVLVTFADALDAGMIPNSFDEYGGRASYNSVDASLWFVVAADRYVSASGDEPAWRNVLAGPVDRILRAYHDGTRFDIRADADGLLAGGDETTQLTWMDVHLAGKAVTPRYGKCVEVNALWHAALRIAARRAGDAYQGKIYADLADQVAGAYAAAFWNDQAGCLYDCVTEDRKDASIRPNQILAVSLPDRLLSPQQEQSVVEVVRRELLTPCGLRTLAPHDPRYRGRYGGSWESRDRAYHQGTVWPWLMGAFVEAYLKVNGYSPQARAQADQWLRPFDAHLGEAGIGYISEIFDGDPPHWPAGCVAQAWSVAEVLRAKCLVRAPVPK